MRLLSLLIPFVIVTSDLIAADPGAPSPQALVTELYQSDKKGASPFGETKERAKICDHYFAEDLAALILKDIDTSQKNNEPGVLDFDPLYGAQDLEIKKLIVNKAVTAKGKTTVLVSFMNYDAKKTTKLDLVQQDGAWKISDIHYSEGPSLRKLFTEAGVKP